MTRLIPPGEFNALARPFDFEAFRFEAQQVYRGSGEDAWIAAFERGDLNPPPDPDQAEWETAIRAHRAAGRLVRRVHVVVEPLSPYVAFEVAWAYPPNIVAGEDVRIIPVRNGDWPSDLPRLDFHLYDRRDLLVAHYAADATWLGVEPVADEARVRDAMRWRDVALRFSMPWRAYVDSRPSLAARVLAA